MKKVRVITLLILLGFAQQICADVLVVVGKNNANQQMNKSQVIDIFLGRYVVFPDGSQAKPLDVNDAELKRRFYLGLTGLNMARVNAYWSRIKFSGKARKPQEIEGVEVVLQQLATGDAEIAYIDKASLTDDLKVVYVINE